VPEADKFHVVQFEDFELVIATGELKAGNGKVIYLSEQPLRTLVALLERPGELLLREDLRKRLWPNDTVVEFEHSIRAAMNRLRQALGDSAENPRFIETLARRGYRWKTRVRWVPTETAVPPKTSISSTDGNLIGKRVAHYRVLEVLGGGGMGVVYKAEDIKLGRLVALKFLPEELADDPISMERFEREARAASALNHPNICTIHRVEEHEGKHFIEMELLEGETLRDVICRTERNDTSPTLELLPVMKCVGWALQIAEGLTAAHEHGIIHRDIKPANIFLTKHGRVKILDFGLAKRKDVESADSERHATAVSEARSGSDPTLTRTGFAIGTAGYMSPEQVRGEQLDARTDIFSFGLVLYEMITGKRAFAGETAPLLHAAILEKIQTPVQKLNSEIPEKLAEIVDRALKKDRAARYGTVSEMHSDLTSVLREASTMNPWGQRAATAIVALLIVTIGTVWWVNRHTSSRAHREFRQRQITVNSRENPVTGGVISPDGKYLAYTDLDGIHLKLVESGESRFIQPPNVFEGKTPNWELGSWQPDSAHFFAIAELPHQPVTLWSISVAGDQQRKIAEGTNPWGISRDGSMLAITRRNDHEIWLIQPDGGNPRKVYDGGDNTTFRAVQFSPDGSRLAYIRDTVVNGTNVLQLESRDLDGGSPLSMLSGPAAIEISQVEEGLRDMIWLPDNRLIYVGGEPYIHGMSCNLWQGQVDRGTGKFIAAPERLTNWAGFCVNTLSGTADGKKLAFNQSYDLEVVYAADFDPAKVQLSAPRRLTFTDDLSSPTGWTPDGSAVLIRSNREGTWGIYKQPLGGGPSESVITKLKNVSWSTPVSPDGKWLIYFQYDASDPSRPIHIMRVPLSGGPAQEIVKVQSGTVRCPRITSAKCVLAEISPEHNQIIFSAFDPLTGRGNELKRFANDHAAELEWDLSPDGTSVVAFRDTDSQFHIIPLHLTGRERILQTQNGINLKNLLWAADGKGFFASAPTQRGAEFVYVNLQGKSKHLWELSGYNVFIAGRASPNGRHLAIQGSAGNSNVWIMENF